MTTSATRFLDQLGQTLQGHFAANKRVLSFAEYLEIVEREPTVHLRNSAHYLRDMFDFYGSEQVRHPSGTIRRFRLFDVPWDEGRGRLIGQEEVQNHLYRILNNFVRQRRIDRFVLLHGPNGSSKSTFTDVIARAMEDYSAHDHGAIYRFNWIFPTQKLGKVGIGFGGEHHDARLGDSYAHLDEDLIDARLPCDLRDHPLLLIPREQRVPLLESLLNKGGREGNGSSGKRSKKTVPQEFLLSDYLRSGELSHKNKLIYEALLSSYGGDYLKVLRHVQVERFFISRRYGVGVARVEPNLAVDARARQVTMDRSLSALPSSLQSVALYEVDGDLVRGNRGMIDFPDLFKRPFDAYKYLLTSVEDSRVALDHAGLYLDIVFIGSANELQLNAFMESPDWMSFKARFELVRVPYLLDYVREEEIYRQFVATANISRPVAPHATEVAALWAVLTRLVKPDLERYARADLLKGMVEKLSPMEKALLYATGEVPKGLNEEEQKVLRNAIADIYTETTNKLAYEGRTGASPREIKTLLMNAGQRERYPSLTAESVLQEIAEFVKETTVYPFLRQEVQRPGYFDHRGFIDEVREWFLQHVDNEVRRAIGLVEEASYLELFERYVTHVTHALRRERIQNSVTGKYEEPDQRLMERVEQDLEREEEADEFRKSLMSKIGGWSLDHPGERPDYRRIFPEFFSRMHDRYYQQQMKSVSRTLRDALELIADTTVALPAERDKEARRLIERMTSEYGYDQDSAREAMTLLVRHHYADMD